MPNMSVKDVPDQWAEALRQRAARNHRSLQGEFVAIIERAVQESAVPVAASAHSGMASPRGTVVGFDRFSHAITRHGWKSVEQVVAEMRALYPEPVGRLPCEHVAARLVCGRAARAVPGAATCSHRLQHAGRRSVSGNLA